MYYLYIWHCPPSYVKIGISANPESRLLHTQANNPYIMTLIAKIAYPDEILASQAETYLCYALSSFKVHGEWFEIPISQLIAICKFIEVSVECTLSVSYPDYQVNMRQSTKTKLNQKVAIQCIRDNQEKYETIRKSVLEQNPTANKRDIAEAIAIAMTGDAKGYMTVMRAYKQLDIEL